MCVILIAQLLRLVGSRERGNRFNQTSKIAVVKTY